MSRPRAGFYLRFVIGIDEAHSIEREARRQWARAVSADESRVLFERSGGSEHRCAKPVSRDLATSEGLYALSGPYCQGDVDGCARSMAIADVFDGVRELGRRARGGYDNANLWIGPELRESDDWHDFLPSAYAAIDALEQADKSVDALVQAVAADKPEVVVDLGDISRRLHELAENLKLIIDGTDEHYVYSLQVNRRLRAGGEINDRRAHRHWRGLGNRVAARGSHGYLCLGDHDGVQKL